MRFGAQVSPSQLFFASESGLSLALVNLKPLVPGRATRLQLCPQPHPAPLNCGPSDAIDPASHALAIPHL